MMGRIHALSGFSAGLAGAALLGVPPGQSVFLGLVCGGAATLPDIDHPDASISNTFGPLTQVFAFLVRKLAGGHRNGTHSAFGAGLFTLLAFASTALHLGSVDVAMYGLAAAPIVAATGLPVRLVHGPCGTSYKSRWAPLAVGLVVVITVAALAAATVSWGRLVGTCLLAVLLVLSLSALLRAMQVSIATRAMGVPDWLDDALAMGFVYLALRPEALGDVALRFVDFTLIPWALLVGFVVHSAGDAITKGGVPWGWPLSQAYVGPQWIMTDGVVERRVIAPAFVVAVGATMAYLAGVVAAVGVGLALAWLLHKGTRGKAKKSSAKRRRTTGKRARQPLARRAK